MTELARSQIAGAVVVPRVATESLEEREDQQSSYSEQQQEKIDSER